MTQLSEEDIKTLCDYFELLMEIENSINKQDS